MVTVETPIGNIGLAVCYDVRFPGLFTAMGDIDILVLPAAFTQRTGEAHWHALLQARAIEKQCFVVAANQNGVHANGRETYGHSLVLSPWGETLAERKTDVGLVSAKVDIAEKKPSNRICRLPNITDSGVTLSKSVERHLLSDSGLDITKLERALATIHRHIPTMPIYIFSQASTAGCWKMALLKKAAIT